MVPFPGHFCFDILHGAGVIYLLESDRAVISWKKQGEAIVGGLALAGGGRGNVILVGPACNPKGATIIIPGDDPKLPQTALLPAGSEKLSPGDYVEILCMQERGFGDRNFPAPGDFA